MNYRHSEILAAESITTAATKTIDLNIADPISRLMVVVKLTNSSWTPVGHGMSAITKIELVDGSDVLYSMNGRQAQACSFYGTGLLDHNELNYDDNGNMLCCASLYFGRYIWDELLALDPRQFNNLQLKITHNYLLGGGTPDAATLQVIADVFDGKVIQPMGFLLNKEHYSYTPTAGAAQYIDLPTDLPVRMLILGNTNDAEGPDVQLENIKLTEEHDKRVVIDSTFFTLLRLVEHLYPVTSEVISTRIITTPRYVWLTHAYDQRILGIEAAAVDTYIWKPWTGGLKQTLDTGSAVDFHGEAAGRCPHGGFPILGGKRDVIEDWWDVTQLGSVRLKITPRSTCDVAMPNWVITSQLRAY